ncbi:MAG TPA: LysR family transcriptional regulator [Rhizobiaceae bacterium]|nr:LysR family transcriptional regulator [Rhizobiaceae bacterium]
MTDLEDMRLFVEVAEQGGFSRAAATLGISKSIVSRRVAAMEEDLGAQLFRRTTRGMSPTEAGLEFKARAERILADYAEAREAVARESGQMVGRLRVSAPLSFGMRHVAPVLAAMAARHPGLEIDVSFSDRMVDLIGERYDAAVRIGSLRDSSLVARRVASVRAHLVASPTYLERHGRPMTPADLARHECLIYSGSVSPEWSLRSGRRTITIRPAGRLRSDNGDTLVQWAVMGLGITNSPSFLVSDELESGKLESVLEDFATPEYGVYVVRPPGAEVPAKVRALSDEMADHFGRVGGL